MRQMRQMQQMRQMRQMRHAADAGLELQQEQRAELEKVARSRRTPQAVAQRSRIVLAEGISPGANGQVLSRIRQHHRHQEFLDFLGEIDSHAPSDLELHLIVDNYIRLVVLQPLGVQRDTADTVAAVKESEGLSRLVLTLSFPRNTP